MADFNFVNARLATGGALTCAADVDAVVAAGIDHVVDCRDDFNDAVLFDDHPGISLLWNGVPDDGKPKPPLWFEKTLGFVLPALARPGTKALLHCAAGVNRGPSSLYACLIALGLGHACAKAMIWEHRPQTVVGIRYADDAEAAVKALGYV